MRAYIVSTKWRKEHKLCHLKNMKATTEITQKNRDIAHPTIAVASKPKLFSELDVLIFISSRKRLRNPKCMPSRNLRATSSQVQLNSFRWNRKSVLNRNILIQGFKRVMFLQLEAFVNLAHGHLNWETSASGCSRCSIESFLISDGYFIIGGGKPAPTSGHQSW